MGTFLGNFGQAHISEDQRDVCRQRMERLFREGGMMNIQEVRMFGKNICLLYPVEADQDGKYLFFYNYYENDCWETAGFDKGVFSGKVGYNRFCLVMAAAYALEEQCSDAPCYADLRDSLLTHEPVLGWLRHLFGDEIVLERKSVWDVYEYLKSTNQYYANWHEYLMREADWMEELAIETVEHGTGKALSELEAAESMPEDRDEQGQFLIKVYISTLKAFRDSQEPNADQLRCVMEVLSTADKSTLIERMHDNNETDSIKCLILLSALLPTQIIVKAAAEAYHQDFWELWKRVKDGAPHRMFESSLKRPPVEPVSTMEYLELAPEDMLFHLPPEEIGTLSPETRTWLDGLRVRYQELYQGHRLYPDAIAFQQAMLGALSEARKREEGICAFRDMFYEFITGWENMEYQAMWKIFEELVADEEISIAQLRQYLALLYNRLLRKSVFGT